MSRSNHEKHGLGSLGPRRCTLLWVLLAALSLAPALDPDAALAESHAVKSGSAEADPFVSRDGVLPGRCLRAVDSPLQIVGVISRKVWTGNVERGSTQAYIVDTFEVPGYVDLAVPVLQGWTLGYGEADPTFDLLSLHPMQEEDHHYGFGYATVDVESYSGSTISVGTRIQLADDNGDDPWFGAAKYDVLLFGRPACDPSLSK